MLPGTQVKPIVRLLALGIMTTSLTGCFSFLKGGKGEENVPPPEKQSVSLPANESASKLHGGQRQVTAPASTPNLARAPAAPMPKEVSSGIRAGQCWVQVIIPPRKEIRSLEVVTQDEATRLLVQPAELQHEKRPVVVKEASQTFRVEPPRFREVTEQIKVKDEIRRLIVEPAIYEDREERVMIESARVVLEKCRAAGQRAAGSEATAQVSSMCAREIPARYKTISHRVLVKPESTREEVVPAVYKTITKWVQEEPARTVPVVIPEETRKLMFTEVVKPAQVQEEKLPAETMTVNTVEHKGEPDVAWRQALCERDLTPELTNRLQFVLLDMGYDIDKIDGKLGPRTMRSVIKYQQDQGLASGVITYETLEKLGIVVNAP